MPPTRALLLVPAQVLLAGAAILVAAMWPPASGEMLLVPLAGTDASRVAAVALAGGATILGPGPLRGSLAVLGRRASITRRIPGWNIAVLAAPPGGCGAALRAGAPR